MLKRLRVSGGGRGGLGFGFRVYRVWGLGFRCRGLGGEGWSCGLKQIPCRLGVDYWDKDRLEVQGGNEQEYPLSRAK